MRAIVDAIAEEIRRLNPDTKAYRQFALLFFLVLGGFGGYLLPGRMAAGAVLLTLSLVFAIFGIFRPTGLRRPYRAWMTLAVILGFFVSRSLLIFVYYLIVTPIGWGGRLFGKVFLEKIDPAAETYWVDRRAQRYRPEDSEKMY
jgi:uncharacterized iron-regulated membrane protein